MPDRSQNSHSNTSTQANMTGREVIRGITGENANINHPLSCFRRITKPIDSRFGTVNQAMTDFRARGHYHGPGGLNGRVRDGNGWDPASIVAGSRPGGGQAPSADGGSGCRSHAASESGSCVVVADRSIRDATPEGSGSLDGIEGSSGWHRGSAGRCLRVDRRRRIGVVKRSAVRTGRLRRSPVVHSRPIDLVVFQEPSSINRLETSS